MIWPGSKSENSFSHRITMKPITFYTILNFINVIWSQVQFEPRDTDTGLIFTELFKAHVSYDTFKLTYVINISDFTKLTKRIGTANEKTQELCDTLGRGDLCHVTILQLRNQLGSIMHDVHMLETKKQRNKRGLCDFCGKIQHWAYGVMDAERAEQLYDVYNKLANESVQQHDLIRNQSMLIETVIQSYRTTTMNIEEHLMDLKNEQNGILQIQNNLNETNIKSHIQDCITITALMVDEHNRMLTNINKCLEDAQKGRIPSLIPEYRLKQDLKAIAATLNSNQKLPIEILHEDILHIFRFTEIRTTLYEKILFMEIDMPIAERDDFQLFKVTPVPIRLQHNTIIIKTTANYFLISSDGRKYIPMDQREIDNGIRINENEVLYKPSTIVQHRNDKVCAWKLFEKPSRTNALTICETGVIPSMNYLIIMQRK